MTAEDDTRTAEADLDGATIPGEVNAWPSTPGEFAARWNAATEEERADRLAGQIDASERSIACLLGDHVCQIARAELAQTVAEARAAEAEAELATVKQQRSDNLKAIAERDAVIEEIRGAWTGADIDALLEAAPESVLDRVKAEASAFALEEAAQVIRGIGLVGTHLEWASWLDSRSRLVYRAGADQ